MRKGGERRRGTDKSNAAAAPHPFLMQTRNPKKKRKEKKRKAENVRAYYIYNTLLQERESILFGLAPPVFSLQPEGWLFDYYKLLFVSISIAKQTAEPNCRRAPYFQVCAKEEEDGGGGGGGR